MRILLSAYACDPEAGTEPGNGWNWACHLANEGHDVWVLTGDEGRDARNERSKGIANLHVVEVRAPALDTRVVRGAVRGHLRYGAWLRRSYRTAERLVRAKDFDLIHHVTFASLVWGCPLWRLGVPFVFGPVGGGQVTPPSLARYVARHRWFEVLRAATIRPAMRLNPMVRATVRHAAVVFATNTDTERLVRRCGASVTGLVCDTAVPPAMVGGARARQADDRPVVILWLGRLLPRKGLPLALEALSRTSTATPWRCVIVGGGPLADEVGGWLRHKRLDDRVRWLGSIPWSEVARVYTDADVFLFTSLRDASGAQLFEAAAFGLPIVGLRHQGMADLIPEDVAVTVPVGDADGTAERLALAIASLIDDPATRAKMSEAALRFANENTWPRRVDEVYSTIERVLRGSREVRGASIEA